jgi:predicted small lipoprotein YifL
MKRRTALRSALLITMLAGILAGCGTSAPANVPGLRQVLGTDLIGARGATDADQRKIDRTIVRGCAADVWTADECGRHGEAP